MRVNMNYSEAKSFYENRLEIVYWAEYNIESFQNTIKPRQRPSSDNVQLSLNCSYHVDSKQTAHFLLMKETPIRCDKPQDGAVISNHTSHSPPVAAPPSTSPHPPSAICPHATSITETLAQQSQLGKTTLWSLYSSVAHKPLHAITLKCLFSTVFKMKLQSAYSLFTSSTELSKNCCCYPTDTPVLNPGLLWESSNTKKS